MGRIWPGEGASEGCLAPGVGPKVMFRMRNIRGRCILAVGHHPSEEWEMTQRLSYDHGELRVQILKDGSEKPRCGGWVRS